MTRRKTGRIAISIIAAASMIALGSCSGEGEGANGTEDVLTLGLSGEPPSLDPALQNSHGDTRWLWQSVYDTMLHCEEDGSVVPAAAESFEFSEDATELTMTLRDGMEFSDGTPVDSEAFRVTFEHMQESSGSDSGRVAGVEIDTPDERTVILTAPRPMGQLPSFMCFASGIIAHPDQITSGEVSNAPVSSGPYVLDQDGTTSGSTYRLERRDDYWDADRYEFDQLDLRVMTEGTARLNALMGGQIDGAVIQHEQADEAEASGAHVLTFPAAWAGLYLNDRDGEMVPALGDVRVRQAINMAFDRESIAESTYGHGVTPTTQIFHPEHAGYIAELDERYPYDLDGARDLMAEAGYADGFTIEIPSYSPDSERFNPIAVQQLGELNIDVEVVPLSGPTAIDDILGGRFPVMFARMGTTTEPLFGVVEALGPDSVWNVMGTEDPDLQPLLDRAQTAQGAEVEEVFGEINSYVVEQAWFAPVVADTGHFAVAEASLLPEMTDAWNFNPYIRDFRQP